MADLPNDPANSVSWDWENILYFPDVSPASYAVTTSRSLPLISAKSCWPPYKPYKSLKCIFHSKRTDRRMLPRRRRPAGSARGIHSSPARTFWPGEFCAHVRKWKKMKRRRKMTEAAKVGIVCCQGLSCEADISHLKGYHRQHRMCLSCVNAATVVLDDMPQRYYQ